MVDFLTQDPGIAAYQRGQKIALDERTTNLQNESRVIANTETLAGAPSRLRNLDATADYNRTRADVAQETAPFDVTIRREEANRAPIATASAQHSLNESRANAPLTRQANELRLRTLQTNQTNAELEGFYKSLELLNQGDEAGARYVAEQTGQNIPEEVIQNRTVAAQLGRLAEEARRLYPNSPLRQQEFMTQSTKGLMDTMSSIHGQAQGDPGIAQGVRNRTDPTYPYRVENAPVPDQVSGTTSKPPADVQAATWLMQSGVASNAEEAWSMVRQARIDPSKLQASVFNSWVKALTANQFGAINSEQVATEAEALTTQTLQFLQGAQRPVTTPSGAAPQSGSGMQGDGSPASPYQATTQEQVDWFRNNAQPGSVIIINGQRYGK